MTPKTSNRICKKCEHYQDGRCPLINLDACVHSDLQDKPRVILAVIIIGFIIAILILFGCKKPSEPEYPVIQQSAVQILRQQHRNELSEWDKLILAIAYTESRFKPDAVGKNQDSGVLQITPIFVKEVNRIAGTDYTIEDAFDIEASLNMYSMMQAYYNESRDLDRAIYLHNKSGQYRQTVLKNLEMIRNYEALRAKLIMTNY